MEANRLEVAPQAIVNITEDALWNLMSACSNTGVLTLRESSVSCMCLNAHMHTTDAHQQHLAHCNEDHQSVMTGAECMVACLCSYSLLRLLEHVYRYLTCYVTDTVWH